MDCIYEESEEIFNSNAELVFTSSTEGILNWDDYEILRRLFKFKEKWARSQIKKQCFLAGDNYNIIWGDWLTNHLKGDLHINSTLCSTLRAIWDIEEVNQEKYDQEFKEEEEKQQRDWYLIVNPLLKELQSQFSHFAFQHMFQEFLDSHSLLCKLKLRTLYKVSYYVGKTSLKKKIDS